MPEVLNYLCPFCNREARVGEPCPGCSKKSPKQKKPWQQSRSADGLDLPDDSFDYADFCKREFGKSPHLRVGLKWYWWALALICLIGMLAGILALR